MKKSWLLCCLVATLSTTAQRVDLDRYSFTVAYRDLPKLLIDSSYHSFDFQLEVGPLMRMSIMNDRPAEHLEIEGWRRLDENGHITVHLDIEDLIMVKSDIREREEIKKDKNGKVISRKIWYAPLLTYNYAAKLQITDHTGKQLQQQQLVSRDQQHLYTGSEYPSRVNAANTLLNLVAISADISRDLLFRTISNLSSNLTLQ
jgi:hypothetical protein